EPLVPEDRRCQLDAIRAELRHDHLLCGRPVHGALVVRGQVRGLGDALLPPAAAGRSATGRSIMDVPVAARICSAVTPGAVSASTRPPGVASRTPRSVMIRSTHAFPVSGSVHSSRILGSPSRVVWLMTTISLRTPCTRSIAPPIPLIILPGTDQLARSPRAETCM